MLRGLAQKLHSSARAAEKRAEKLKRLAEGLEGVEVIGPAKAPVSRIKDIYRYTLYVKSEEEAPLRAVKEAAARLPWDGQVLYQFDLE